MVRVVSLLISVVLILTLAGKSKTSLPPSIYKRLTSGENRAQTDTTSNKEGPDRLAANTATVSDEYRKAHPWVDAKPAKMDAKCEMTYATVSPVECRYMRTRVNEHTKHCKAFCDQWVERLKTMFKLPDDCEYDDENGTLWCEGNLSEDCSECDDHMENYYSKCCGTCARASRNCTISQPPH